MSVLVSVVPSSAAPASIRRAACRQSGSPDYRAGERNSKSLWWTARPRVANAHATSSTAGAKDCQRGR